MQKNWHLYLVGLSLVLLMAVAVGLTEAQGQSWLDKTWGDYTWGTYGGDREASRLAREEIVARENYCPTSGCILRLDNVSIRPNRARKGDTLTLSTSYTILTPEQVAIPVAITREIIFQGKSLGRTKSIDSRKLNGSWIQQVDFTLPANAVPGIYTLKTKVSTGFDMKEKETQFQVD